MVKVGFYGAAGEVTGSNFLIDSGTHKYVVDCGLFQGADVVTEHNDDPFVYNPAEVTAVIITHAHLDHIGRLPMLVKNGFRGSIYATEATIELTGLTLKDALEIMTNRAERDNQPILYNEVDLRRTLDLFQPVPYHQQQKLAGEDSFTLYDSGHILGSASVLLEAGGKKIAFSGDIGFWPNTLLPEPESPIEADMVVTEATYGGVNHADQRNRIEVLKEALNWTIAHRGVLLIPAFAVERSQELLYLLNYLFNQHQLPKMPIYLDSPLAIEALEVFERHQELFAKEVQKLRQTDNDIFSFHGLVLTPTSADSRDINQMEPPKVIIAGSGMMEGGRIHHHLKRYLPRDNTLLLVIGYQAENTFGHRLISGAQEVMILGDRIPVRAKIEVVDIFSGHADDRELRKWLKAIKLQKSGRIMIVHSNPERAKNYQAELIKEMPDRTIEIAEIGQSQEVI